jgi:adenylate kinase
MTQAIVAFTGISGVGKTTFLRRLYGYIVFQHLIGGSLISEARETALEDRDRIRNADLDENQRLLIQGFALARNPEARVVIMDGHVVIDSADGIQEIPTTVFEHVGITLMVHLEADPILISQNRARDNARNRPVYTAQVLSALQERSRKRAIEVASTLAVEYVGIRHEDVTAFADLLQNQQSH